MKKLLLLAVLIFALTGCFNVDSVIKLNKDGSGELVQKILFKKSAVQQMKAMAQMNGENPQDPTAYDVEKLKAAAAELGTGVTYKTSKQLDDGEYLGYQVTYKFANIATIKMQNNPMAGVLEAEEAKTPEAEEEKEYMKFSYKKGQLNIKMYDASEGYGYGDDEGEEAEEDMGATPEIGEAQLAMMKQMFGGMKMSLKIEMPSKVKKSSASYAKNNVVTLFEMDFDKLIENPDAIKNLHKINPQSPEDAQKALAKLPGVKAEVKPFVKINF